MIHLAQQPELVHVGHFNDLKPERRLWAAVLLMGVNDYIKAKQGELRKWEWHMTETQLIDDEEFRVTWDRDPISWFESDAEEPRCFKWMCQILGVDARRIRDHVNARLEARLAA